MSSYTLSIHPRKHCASVGLKEVLQHYLCARGAAATATDDGEKGAERVSQRCCLSESSWKLSLNRGAATSELDDTLVDAKGLMRNTIPHVAPQSVYDSGLPTRNNNCNRSGFPPPELGWSSLQPRTITLRVRRSQQRARQASSAAGGVPTTPKASERHNCRSSKSKKNYYCRVARCSGSPLRMRLRVRFSYFRFRQKASWRNHFRSDRCQGMRRRHFDYFSQNQ